MSPGWGCVTDSHRKGCHPPPARCAHSGLHIPDIAHIPPAFLTYHTLTHGELWASHWSHGVTEASDWLLASHWAALHITFSATPAEIEQAAAATPPLTYLKIFQNILKPFIVTGTAESPDWRNGRLDSFLCHQMSRWFIFKDPSQVLTIPFHTLKASLNVNRSPNKVSLTYTTRYLLV